MPSTNPMASSVAIHSMLGSPDTGGLHQVCGVLGADGLARCQVDQVFVNDAADAKLPFDGLLIGPALIAHRLHG